MNLRVGILVFAAATLTASAQQPKYQQGGQPEKSSGTTQAGKKQTGTSQAAGKYSYSPQFTEADRGTIRTCMSGTYGNLPAGAKARPLPPALDKQLQVNAPLPAGLQTRARPLPDICASRLLGTLPANWSRVLVGDRVVLLDANQKVADMFSLD